MKTTEVDLPLGCSEVRVAEMCVVETEWDGEPAFLATLRDVSERKALETQLRQKVDELAESHRLKDEFLAMLAHELRNPLAPIRNAVHIMKARTGENALLSRMCEIIEHQVCSMTRLVDDLLDVSRITTGKIKLRQEPIDLEVIIKAAVESTGSLFQAKDHALKVTYCTQRLDLIADPVRIEQILVNLLTNAAKYTDAGGHIEVSTRREEAEAVVAVRDNGVGIEPSKLDQIFDLFQQIDQALDRSSGGLGIGLTLARRLARLHGGDLSGHSAGLGQGSEFVLRLPLAEKPLRATDGPAQGPAPAASRHQRRRVLIVDDNLAMAHSLSEIVGLRGHECRIVHSGRAAMREAMAYFPDIVLLDIGLPGMDGFAVAPALRKLPGLARVEIIAMGGYGQTQDLIQAEAAGIDRYLVKPIDLGILRALLEHSQPAIPTNHLDPYPNPEDQTAP
ncbi:MAG: hybrid sensor histidine kinase/response regulator [Planctomycetaceae bacterium]|nr:hybrid sensor histidine kinase/response regulator [Planctomycetaceae bacterium]